MRTTMLAGLLCLSLAFAGCAPSRHIVEYRNAPGALGPYSGSVSSGGFCFLSGKIGERGGTFEHEVETALDAVEAELRRADLDFGDVVQVNVFLTDIGDYAAFNEIYGRRVPRPYPARACVAVTALPGGARVEIQVVAAVS